MRMTINIDCTINKLKFKPPYNYMPNNQRKFNYWWQFYKTRVSLLVSPVLVLFVRELHLINLMRDLNLVIGFMYWNDSLNFEKMNFLNWIFKFFPKTSTIITLYKTICLLTFHGFCLLALCIQDWEFELGPDFGFVW